MEIIGNTKKKFSDETSHEEDDLFEIEIRRWISHNLHLYNKREGSKHMPLSQNISFTGD